MSRLEWVCFQNIILRGEILGHHHTRRVGLTTISKKIYCTRYLAVGLGYLAPNITIYDARCILKLVATLACTMFFS